MEIYFNTGKNVGPFTFEDCGALFFIDGEVVPGPFVLNNEAFPLNKKVKSRSLAMHRYDLNVRRNKRVPFNSPQAFELCRYLHRLCFDGNMFGFWEFTDHSVRRYDPNVSWVSLHPSKLTIPARYQDFLARTIKASTGDHDKYEHYKDPPRSFNDNGWEGISKRTLNHLPRMRNEVLLFQTQLLLLGIETHK